ncbi:hypothetical protein Tco_1260241 [Tanacetum coccineum]
MPWGFVGLPTWHGFKWRRGEVFVHGVFEVQGRRGKANPFHDHTQAIPDHRIQTIEGVQREQGHRIVGVESAVIALTERLAELERDNRRPNIFGFFFFFSRLPV